MVLCCVIRYLHTPSPIRLMKKSLFSPARPESVKTASCSWTHLSPSSVLDTLTCENPLVALVCLICLVYLVEPDKPQTKRTAFLNSLKVQRNSGHWHDVVHFLTLVLRLDTLLSYLNEAGVHDLCHRRCWLYRFAYLRGAA